MLRRKNEKLIERNKNMKIYVDDARMPPPGYVLCRTTNEAKLLITCIHNMHSIEHRENLPEIELIDLDHDAGDMAPYGGDYINILRWMERNQISIPVKIHSMNPVGKMNMEAICKKNGWTIIR